MSEPIGKEGKPMSEQPKMTEEQLTYEIKRLRKSVAGWKADAKRYAINADYWRERAEKAEKQLVTQEEEPR